MHESCSSAGEDIISDQMFKLCSCHSDYMCVYVSSIQWYITFMIVYVISIATVMFSYVTTWSGKDIAHNCHLRKDCSRFALSYCCWDYDVNDVHTCSYSSCSDLMYHRVEWSMQLGEWWVCCLACMTTYDSFTYYWILHISVYFLFLSIASKYLRGIIIMVSL